MNVTLTLQKRYDLEINGVVFKDMRVTGELEGIMELANDTSRATMLWTGSALGAYLHTALSGGVDENWLPIRGTPDVIEAMKADAIEDGRIMSDAASKAAIDALRAEPPLVWLDLICEHDWVVYAGNGKPYHTCMYCKQSEALDAHRC